MDANEVLAEITRQCAAVLQAGDVPLYVELGAHPYAALEGRLGRGYDAVEVDEPAGEVQPAPGLPVHFTQAGGKHVLAVTHVDEPNRVHVVGSGTPARELD